MTDNGCRCQGCGQHYRVDLLLTDELWAEIRPDRTEEQPLNLLCGPCITKRLEDRNRFDAFALVSCNALSNSEGENKALREWKRAAIQARNDLQAISDEFEKATEWKECPIGPGTRWAKWCSPANTIRWIGELEAKHADPGGGGEDRA